MEKLIDSLETLEVKIKEVKQAQRYFQLIVKIGLIKFLKQPQLLQIKIEFYLQKWL